MVKKSPEKRTVVFGTYVHPGLLASSVPTATLDPSLVAAEKLTHAILIVGWVILAMIFLVSALAACLIVGLVWWKGTAVLSGLSTLVALSIFIGMGSGLFEDATKDIGGGVIIKSQPFFIPRTDVDVTSLDQVVALCGGFITLLFSIYEAFRARRHSRVAPDDQRRNIACGMNQRPVGNPSQVIRAPVMVENNLGF